MTITGKEKSIYESYTGAPEANDLDQHRNAQLNDGRRNCGTDMGEASELADAQVQTTDREMGTHLDMGTEDDMQELQNTGASRDPGAKKTLEDDVPMEKRY